MATNKLPDAGPPGRRGPLPARSAARRSEPPGGVVSQEKVLAEIAHELAYRLYTVSERKKRAAEALEYNGLVQSWPEIVRLAREGVPSTEQAGLFEQE